MSTRSRAVLILLAGSLLTGCGSTRHQAAVPTPAPAAAPIVAQRTQIVPLVSGDSVGANVFFRHSQALAQAAYDNAPTRYAKVEPDR